MAYGLWPMAYGLALPILPAPMPHTWQELFITGEDRPSALSPPPSEERQGFFRSLRQNLSKRRKALGASLQATVFQTLDEGAGERLGETFIYADVGAATPGRFV